MPFDRIARFRTCFTAVVLLSLGIVTLDPVEATPVSRSIALEIIVKFSDDSDTGRRVARILREHPQDLSGLVALRDELHRSTSFVLTPERVTSGRELILGVPEKPLLESVAQTVTKRPQVTAAELVAIQEENPRLPQHMLLVHFRASGNEVELLGKARGRKAGDGRVQALAAELCAPSGVPVLGAPGADDALAVTVDRYTVLEQIASRLTALEDVDYAQPNTTVGIGIVK
jgi:hypothetical protein